MVGSDGSAVALSGISAVPALTVPRKDTDLFKVIGRALGTDKRPFGGSPAT